MVVTGAMEERRYEIRQRRAQDECNRDASSTLINLNLSDIGGVAHCYDVNYGYQFYSVPYATLNDITCGVLSTDNENDLNKIYFLITFVFQFVFGFGLIVVNVGINDLVFIRFVLSKINQK